MKVVLFSDLHAHSFKSYSSTLDTGVNSRLEDAINVIRKVKELALDERADLILFGGDLFHVRRTIPVQTFNYVYETIEDLASTKIPIVMIDGNHDQADKNGNEHSLYAFKSIKGVTVIDELNWLNIGKFAICCVPYTEDVKAIRKLTRRPQLDKSLYNIFLGHLGIQGYKVGADFVWSNAFDPKLEDLNPYSFDVGFLGHYHLRQKVGDNFHYIGAPIQHNWGDKDQERGVMVFDTSTKKYQIHPTDAPKFIEVPVKKLKKSNELANNIVKVIDDRVWSDDEKETFKLKSKAKFVEVVVEEDKKVITPRMVVSPTASLQDIIDGYINSNDLGGLDSVYLKELAKDVLTELDDI